ncbi:hypothetical protein LZ32DRAFT_604531 [Colletotrichum eremochloae]|nr:hypothetical protein LZ32DRAFT_604531 [Colletotrichum eremochloae]
MEKLRRGHGWIFVRLSSLFGPNPAIVLALLCAYLLLWHTGQNTRVDVIDPL